MQEYEILESARVEFGTVSYNELSEESKAMYQRGKALKRDEFVDF
jgi:hypothetical protein